MKVSVCMIVWNEAELIERAIRSAGVLADEVVVLDTGSEDDTLDIAGALGAVTLTGGDRMHKGRSRNAAMASASSDWIVILDADEQIADPGGLRQHIEQTGADALYVQLHNMSGDHVSQSWAQMRCWKRGAYQYRYRAHEVPIAQIESPTIEYTGFVFEHRQPAARWEWKAQYTLDRLLLDVEENPGAARPLFYLGRQYVYMQQWEQARETLEAYVDQYPDAYDSADAYSHLARAYGQLGQKRDRIEALFCAFIRNPNRREFLGELAEIYRADNQQQIAAGLLELAVKLPEPQGAYRASAWYGAHPHDLIARCYWKMSAPGDGIAHARQAVQLEPWDSRLWANLAYFERAEQGGRDVQYWQSGKHRREGLAVLYLGFEDCAGVGHRMAQAINATGEHRARSVAYQANYLRYPVDHFRPTEAELEELLRWADVIHCLDDVPPAIAEMGKPVFVTYNGSRYRADWEAMNERHEAMGVKRQFCTSIDLARFGAEWMPIPMGPLPQAEPYTDGVFRVAQAPTVRRRKRTDEVVEQLADVEGVELDIIEGTGNAECLQRKRRAHTIADQFDLGYGVNALEAWAMGLPVIANAGADVLGLIRDAIGYLPFEQSTVHGIGATVRILKSHQPTYDAARERGIRYLAEFHDPATVASRLVEAYRA